MSMGTLRSGRKYRPTAKNSSSSSSSRQVWAGLSVTPHREQTLHPATPHIQNLCFLIHLHTLLIRTMHNDLPDSRSITHELFLFIPSAVWPIWSMRTQSCIEAEFLRMQSNIKSALMLVWHEVTRPQCQSEFSIGAHSGDRRSFQSYHMISDFTELSGRNLGTRRTWEFMFYLPWQTGPTLRPSDFHPTWAVLGLSQLFFQCEAGLIPLQSVVWWVYSPEKFRGNFPGICS